MPKSKLNPCPFCGGEASVKAETRTSYQDPPYFHVFAKCESCGVSAPGVACEFRVNGDYMDVYNAAANQWNERAEKQPAADVVPKLTAKWGEPIFVGDAWAVPCPRCFYATAIRHKEIRPRYCSNCGAEMNGESQKPDPRLLEGYRDGLLIAISGELHIPIDVLLKITEEREKNNAKK